MTQPPEQPLGDPYEAPFWRGEKGQWPGTACDYVGPGAVACDEPSTYLVEWQPHVGDEGMVPVSGACTEHGVLAESLRGHIVQLKTHRASGATPTARAGQGTDQGAPQRPRGPPGGPDQRPRAGPRPDRRRAEHQRAARRDDRAVPEHWEGDMVSGSANSHVATLVERSSRYVQIVKLQNKTTDCVIAALTARVQELPEQLKQSLTWDRRMELAKHKEVTVDTGVQVYFCDPNSPWSAGRTRTPTA